MNAIPCPLLAARQRIGEIMGVIFPATPRGSRVRRNAGALLLTAVLAVMPALPASAQGPTGPAGCDPSRRVQRIDFTGAPQFDDATLSAAIVTREPSYAARVLHVGQLPCSEPREVQLDALRLAVLHRQAGWLQARVVATTTSTARGLQLRFEVAPGAPFLLDTLTLNGLPTTPPDAPTAQSVEAMRAMQMRRFDRIRLDTTITALVAALRDAGYARAIRPTVTVRIDTLTSRVRVSADFTTGQVTTIRTVTVVNQGLGSAPATIDTGAVRRLTNLRGGRRFREVDILDAQRDLYRADAFRLVLIDTLTPDLPAPARDSLIDLRITVAEAPARNARAGIGWATLDCGRAQTRLVDRRTLGVGRRLEVNARVSKLGVGAPADFAPSFCSQALRADTLFTVMNHYLGASLTSTHLFGTPLSPVISLYTERRSEPYAYIREIGVGALMELARTVSPRTALTGGFQYENGRTRIDPAESCARFGQCQQADYESSLFGRGVAVLSSAITHDRTNNAIDPGRGIRLRGEVRAGMTDSRTNAAVRFFRLSGEVAQFHRVAGGVLATRLQLARAFAPGAELVDGAPLLPTQERIFSGGQNSVRGFQQNLLGPLVYVVSRIDSTQVGGVPIVQVQSGAGYDRAVPRGGSAQLLANVEYRRNLRWLAEQLQLVGFLDVGSLWEADVERFQLSSLRATPGIGVRLVTPLGPFRVDIGYSPYPPRAGRALYLARGVGGVGGTIQCASPGNQVSIDPAHPGSIFDCPDSYAPPSARGVLSRLVFHFGLGQAF